MYSKCHYWSKTSSGRGEWIIKLCQSQKRSWSLRQEVTRSMRSKQSSTMQCMANRPTAIKCQVSTTSFCRRATQKKKTPGSLYRQLYTSENWSTPSIKSIQKSQQCPLYPWTSLYQWPSQRFQNKNRNKSVTVQAKEPISEVESKAPSVGALCGPRYRCRAQAFDPKLLDSSSLSLINQSASGFPPSFS